MNFVHTEFHGGPNDIALVTLDSQANAMLLSDSDFSAYRHGRSFEYFGGWTTHSPVRLVPPREGHWHVIVDLGGHAGTVQASVRIARKNPI